MPFAVKRNGTPLNYINKYYGDDNWEESNVFAELRTAKSWGLTPRQWWDEDNESRAAMIAFEITESKVNAVLAFDREYKKK